MNLSVFDSLTPFYLKQIIDSLQVHCDPFKTVGDFERNGLDVNASDLLEVGKLGDLHAVEPYFPSKTPGPERRRFPIIFDKTDIVPDRINADMCHTLKVQILAFQRRGLKHHLILVILLQSVRVISVAPVSRTPAWLNIRCSPRFGAQHSEKCCSMKSACPYFGVIRLKKNTTLFGPEII